MNKSFTCLIKILLTFLGGLYMVAISKKKIGSCLLQFIPFCASLIICYTILN
jgi:hypothetical protein